MRLYLGNLSFGTDEAELRGVLEPFGRLDSVIIVTDRETGRSRGFGFAEYTDAAEASAAIQALNGSLLGGRNIVVSEARAREESSDRRGGGRSRPW